jgi:shikimate kinase
MRSDGSEPFRLFLIGPMGSGKSTVGKQLASLLNCDFIDSDAEIETRSGANIPWIFDVEGEEGFRRREAAVIIDLAQRPNAVIATGGGAVIREDNRTVMADSGVLVYLDVSLENQIKRTGSGDDRPLLNGADKRETLSRLMQEREPLYRSIADIIVTANAGNARKVARQIKDQLVQRALWQAEPQKDAHSETGK